jgi:hypothetical protein
MPSFAIVPPVVVNHVAFLLTWYNYLHGVEGLACILPRHVRAPLGPVRALSGRVRTPLRSVRPF